MKGLERQLKEKDMHYRLKWIEDMKQIRDQVKAETNITLRDYESRHYDYVLCAEIWKNIRKKLGEKAGIPDNIFCQMHKNRNKSFN